MAFHQAPQHRHDIGVLAKTWCPLLYFAVWLDVVSRSGSVWGLLRKETPSTNQVMEGAWDQGIHVQA